MPFLQRSRQAPLARVSSRFLAAVAACACSLGLGGLCLAEPVSKSCQAAALGPKAGEEQLEALGRPVPRYMLKACNGDRCLALRRWKETLTWRCNIGDEEIVSRPNPMYFKIQPHYPTFLHLTDRSGRLTYWEIIGKMDPSALKNAGITVNDIRANYIWQTLFTWDVWLQRDDVQEGTVIVDLEGFRFSQVTLFVVQMFAKTSSIIQRHFPDRDHVLIVINAPEWWGRVYDLFSPLFPEKQRRKLRVSVGQQASMQTLREYIDPKNLPAEYGGSSGPLGSAPADAARRRSAAEGASPAARLKGARARAATGVGPLGLT
ncbi:unnamed protein product [Effrenium voratum]|nr:unnamed protein product [Effrenium voratum]